MLLQNSEYSGLVTNTVVSNDHGHTQRYDFSVLDRKHPFWSNLAQKI